MENDRLSGIAATPFSLLALHYANFIYCASVLFPRRFLELGCRFDDARGARGLGFLAPDRAARTAAAGAAGDGQLPCDDRHLGCVGGARAAEATHCSAHGKPCVPNGEAAPRRLWAPIEPRLREAIRLHEAGDLAGAMEIYREIQAMAPNEPSSLHALARAHLDRGESADARSACDIALQLAPRSGEFRLTRASIALAEGNAAEARTLRVGSPLACAGARLGRGPGPCCCGRHRPSGSAGAGVAQRAVSLRQRKAPQALLRDAAAAGTQLDLNPRPVAPHARAMRLERGLHAARRRAPTSITTPASGVALPGSWAATGQASWSKCRQTSSVRKRLRAAYTWRSPVPLCCRT